MPASSAHCSAALVVLLALGAACPAADAYRVLGVFPFNGRSHNVMFKALMGALADRGHEVVMLSPFPLETPRANYTDLDVSEVLPSMDNAFTYERMTSFKRHRIIHVIAETAGADVCRKVFLTKHFQEVLNGRHGKFDVVLTEIFGSDCWTVVAHKLNLPLISLATAPDFAWMHARVGAPTNPSYIVTCREVWVGRMTLWQRLSNAAVHLLSNYMYEVLINGPSDVVVREFFGEDTPPIGDLVKRTSLILVNRHVSVNPARPLPPNVVHVGGLHLHAFKPDRSGAGLEPGLRKWMDGAEHGVVFFTLGSLVRSASLPRPTIEALLAAFAELPQRVLWKYEADDIALPPNVRTASWMPQADVLAHRNTILFITHGGLMGTTEALVLGVPMLGIPLFADQYPNVLLYQSLGIAEKLDHDNITKDNVLTTIRQLTTTDKYRVRSKEVAALYVDRPLTASEEAVWWTEYVIRNKGAPHLRPIGADLPLYQYLLLDVAAIAVVAVVAVLVLLWAAVRALRCAVRALMAAMTPVPVEKQD